MGSVCLLLESSLLPVAGKGGLEAVVDTESEVVAVQVEAETVLAEGRVVVVSIAVAEEAAVSHEVNILGQVHADTGLDTYYTFKIEVQLFRPLPRLRSVAEKAREGTHSNRVYRQYKKRIRGSHCLPKD